MRTPTGSVLVQGWGRGLPPAPHPEASPPDMVIAIDPGSTRSGWCECHVYPPLMGDIARAIEPAARGETANEILRAWLWSASLPADRRVVFLLESIPGIYGSTTGRDQLMAQEWLARFEEILTCRKERHALPRLSWHRVTRVAARVAVTENARASDRDVRQALLDAYGGERRARGVKCKPCKGRGWRGRGRPECEACEGSGWEVPVGPLHGWTGSHVFAALALVFAAYRSGGVA